MLSKKQLTKILNEHQSRCLDDAEDFSVVLNSLHEEINKLLKYSIVTTKYTKKFPSKTGIYLTFGGEPGAPHRYNTMCVIKAGNKETYAYIDGRPVDKNYYVGLFAEIVSMYEPKSVK